MGGYIGALVAAFFIAVPYHWAWTIYENLEGGPRPESLGALLVEITIAAALSACVLGVLAVFFSSITISGGFRLRLVNNPTRANIIIGACIGGAIAGAVAAPVLMMYFGRLNRPDMTPVLLLPGAIVGASIIVFSIVSFNFEQLTLKRLFSGVLASIAALTCGLVCVGIFFRLLYQAGLVTFIITWLESVTLTSDPALILGGMVYGAPVGLSLGFVIGLAPVITQTLSGKIGGNIFQERGAAKRRGRACPFFILFSWLGRLLLCAGKRGLRTQVRPPRLWVAK